MIGRISARPKLVSGFESSARAHLALTIAIAKTAAEKAGRVKAARISLLAAYEAAHDGVEVARAALEAAQAAASAHLVAVASGTAGEVPGSVKVARLALVEAADALDAANRARTALDRDRDAARDDQERADKAVSAAALAVLRDSPAAQTMVDEVERMQMELIATGRALGWLVRNGVLPGGDAPSAIHQDYPHRRIAVAVRYVDAMPPHLDMIPRVMTAFEVHPAALAWKQALNALRTDASAPVPALGAV